MTRLLRLAIFLLPLVSSVSALAGPKQCVANHEEGIAEYQAGKLRSARELGKACAQESCPKLIRGDCVLLLERVAADMPSIVPSATDGSGSDLVDVKVSIDGAILTERLDGRALDLDPGEHSVRFEIADGQTQTLQLLVKQGEKNRRVVARFASAASERHRSAPEPAPASSEPRADRARPGPPAAAWILGGLGVVALGSFGYFALSGKSEQRDLEDRCAPACTKDEYRDMKRKYLFADVSLGVAAVSLGVATYLFVAPRGGSPRSEVGVARRGGSPRSEVGVGVAPGTARLELRGSF